MTTTITCRYDDCVEEGEVCPHNAEDETCDCLITCPTCRQSLELPPCCHLCGVEKRVEKGLCAWCRADKNDRPWGSCLSCKGAKDQDGTCACRPPTTRMGHR